MAYGIALAEELAMSNPINISVLWLLLYIISNNSSSNIIIISSSSRSIVWSWEEPDHSGVPAGPGAESMETQRGGRAWDGASANIYIYIYIYIHTHTALNIYIYIYTHTALNIYIYIYIYIYTHTHRTQVPRRQAAEGGVQGSLQALPGSNRTSIARLS